MVNNLFIRLGLDKIMTTNFGIYKRIKINTQLSPQQMAGFSSRPSVQEAIDKTHLKLQEIIQQKLKSGDKILDIGCGAGAYLINIKGDFELTGIDLNEEMIQAAKSKLPNATFIKDDFLKHDFDHKFNLIYSVSTLEFIPPSQLRAFFRKVQLILEPDGILFLHYPHALRFKDTLYPDLYYIEYSPRKVEYELRDHYQIISHQHGFDNRIIDLYDQKPYEPGIRTFKNGYLLIASPKGKPTH
ncbi:MAG: methyltransferase domain-containing protein [Bacteroidetes bacterium]|nr:methyltransferase domain-containing protein [Bacteroidota bacterium]